MMKFHINKQGKVAPCKATTKPCPVGTKHFEANSVEDAYKIFNEEMKTGFGILATSNNNEIKDRDWYKKQLELLNKKNEDGTDLYPDGTYIIGTNETVWHDKGWQVTFYLKNDKYSDEDHKELLELFLKYSENKTIEAGKYGGTPELSFYVEDKETAIALGEIFGQDTVFNWEERTKDFLEFEPENDDDNVHNQFSESWFIDNPDGNGEWKEDWEQDWWKEKVEKFKQEKENQLQEPKTHKRKLKRKS